jgi:hypothetical protein
MRHGTLRGCLICLAFLSSLALAETKLQHPKETPKVEPKEQPNNRLEPHQDATGIQNAPAPVDPTKSTTEVCDHGFQVTAHPFLELRFNWAIDRRIAV